MSWTILSPSNVWGGVRPTSFLMFLFTEKGARLVLFLYLHQVELISVLNYCLLKVCRILLNDAWGSLCIMNSCYVDYTSDIYISVKESCYFLWIIARVENYSFEYLAWTWTLLCNLVLWSVYTYLLFSLMMKVVLFLYGM